MDYMDVEISYGTKWVSLNDGDSYLINGQDTRDQSQKTFRKITADSIVLGGSYLVHAVPDMVMERIGIWVHGQDQTDMMDNFWFLNTLFEQYDYRIRWTIDDYREYWTCQLADNVSSRGQVWTHSQMASVTFNVPRYPDVVRERML